MTPTLFHAVARKAEALAPDADLLARYVRARDDPSFEELVRRHGPLVWAVCRTLLPCRADAEDAFQAVFLALVRSAATIRDGRALPAWLHGVAVRVATRARRAFERRAARERGAARPEADRPVSDGAWEELVAAVHEEVRRLPEAERAALVLCDLQGVSQPDAAVRLGWPLGSVSGRLCKARQRLLDRLAARGIAPAAVVGVGVTAAEAGAVPAGVFETVRTFSASPVAASSAAAALARGFTEGVTMRVKVTAAVVVAALGLTGGAVLLSQAEAQPPGGLPAGGPPGMGPTPVAGHADPVRVAATWEYKFVDVKNDRQEFEKAITQHGTDGWEFCASERFGVAPAELVLVFKRLKGGAELGPVPGPPGRAGVGPGGGMMGGPGMGGPGMGGPGMGGPGKPGVAPAADGKPRLNQVFRLRNADAAVVAERVQDVLVDRGGNDPLTTCVVIAEPVSNAVLVSADAATLKAVKKLIELIDVKAEAFPAEKGDKNDEFRMTGPSGGPGVPAGPPSGGPSGPRRVEDNFNIFALKNARAEEMVTVLSKLFPGAVLAADLRTNSLIARADLETLKRLQMLISRLDIQDTVKPK